MRDIELVINDINEALQLIRPYLQADGGDVSLVKYEDNGTAMVKLQGACSHCSMSQQTLKAGIEHTIKRSVPEVQEVVAVENEFSEFDDADYLANF